MLDLALLALNGVFASPAPVQSEPTPPADAPVPSEVQQLRDRVAQLENKVSEMAAREGEQWLTEQRADEIRSVVQETLADADARASLADSGATAGWEKGKGFFISSADGNYLLKIGGQLQVRFVYNHQNDSPTDDNSEYGFEIRRAKLFFSGNLFDPTWTYQLEMSASNTSGTFSLGENAWFQKDLGGGFALRAGQFKPWLLREESVTSKKLLGVERSIVNLAFSWGTAQGVQGGYQAEQWRAFLAVVDGANTQNTGWSALDNEFAGSARVEFLPFGSWKDVEDDNGWRGSEPALLFGLAGAFQRGETGSAANGEIDSTTATADATWKMNGFSLAGAFIYRNLDTAQTVATPISANQFGVVVRGGIFLAEDIELYASYEWGDLDTAGTPDLSIATIGITKFFDKHNIKWQTDIGYGFNPVGPAWNTPTSNLASTGWRVDAPDEDGQIVIRSQFQLLF